MGGAAASQKQLMRERVARKLRSNPQLVLFLLAVGASHPYAQRRTPGLLCLGYACADRISLPAGADDTATTEKVEDRRELPAGG